jgi:3-hydroxyisobutyrate dehydrogenase-like beta-hydroxyacid dehydrogenase
MSVEQTPQKPRIGLVGAGVMGLPMAEHLLREGYPLSVWARTPAKVASLVASGASSAATPAKLAAESDVIVGCLLDEHAIEQVYLGADGLFASVRAGHLLVEHGTFAPRVARRLSALADERGAGFLDIPVTGGPHGARAGTLTGIAGGRAEHLAAARPFLEAYCAQVVHIGPSGTGLELKLVNQLLVSTHVAAAAEAAALIDRLGLPPRESKQVLMAGLAASTMLDYCLPAALVPSTAPSGASIGGLAAVQGLVTEVADGLDLTLDVFTAVREVFTPLVDSGAEQQDLSQLARAYDPAATTPLEQG